MKVETARLPPGRGGGGADVGGGGCHAFWDATRGLGGGAGAGAGGGGGGGGATPRRAGELVRTGGDSLAEAALGRRGRTGRDGGVEGVEEKPASCPAILRGGGAGAVREGADDTGLAGGGGGGILPGPIDVPDTLRAGTAGGAGTLRGGRAGTVIDGADVVCG